MPTAPRSAHRPGNATIPHMTNVMYSPTAYRTLHLTPGKQGLNASCTLLSFRKRTRHARPGEAGTHNTHTL